MTGTSNDPEPGAPPGGEPESGTDDGPARVVPIGDKPLGVIDLVDGSFAALRQRARVLVVTVLGLVVPMSLFQGWLTRNYFGGASLTEMLDDPVLLQEGPSLGDAEFLLDRLASMFVTAVAGVAVARIVVGWLYDQDTSAGDALRFTVRQLPAIVVAFVLNHVIQAIGFVLLVVPGLFAVVLGALISPVLAVEECGPIQALQRSWSLVRRRLAAVFGVVAFLAAVAYGVSTAVDTLPSLAAAAIGQDRAWPLISLSRLLTSIVLVPVTSAAMCLTYLDIRFRTEGLDLRRRMDLQLGAGPGAATGPPPPPPPPARQAQEPGPSAHRPPPVHPRLGL